MLSTSFLGILAFAAQANKRTNNFKDEENGGFTAVKTVMNIEFLNLEKHCWC